MTNRSLLLFSTLLHPSHLPPQRVWPFNGSRSVRLLAVCVWPSPPYVVPHLPLTALSPRCSDIGAVLITMDPRPTLSSICDDLIILIHRSNPETASNLLQQYRDLPDYGSGSHSYQESVIHILLLALQNISIPTDMPPPKDTAPPSPPHSSPSSRARCHVPTSWPELCHIVTHIDQERQMFKPIPPSITSCLGSCPPVYDATFQDQAKPCPCQILPLLRHLLRTSQAAHSASAHPTLFPTPAARRTAPDQLAWSAWSLAKIVQPLKPPARGCKEKVPLGIDI
mmetsp:Transcript_49116/g.97938  ORF Transcript_49116/g.97938 Transcript_49116/m.97938 type:complete len:282 (-) Transcript_49116:174-1019(-)